MDHGQHGAGKLVERRKERARIEVINHMTEEIYRHVDHRIADDIEFEKVLDEVLQRKKDPYTLSQELLWQSCLGRLE